MAQELAPWLSGAAGTVALFGGARGDGAPALHLGYVGDCEAMLCRDGAPLRLTRPHRLTDAEAARVADAGGWVTGSETRRLNGVLAVARAFGDIEYKLWKARAWKKSFAADLVTCEPATLHVPLTRDDEFVVVASDGLWDVIGFAEVAARVRAWRAEKGVVDGAADALASEAIARGNKDNTTVCIVELLWEG